MYQILPTSLLKVCWNLLRPKNVNNGIIIFIIKLLFKFPVPAPSATLSSTVAALGSPAILQCKVVLHSSLTCSGPVTAIVDLFAANSTAPLTPSHQTATGSGVSSTCTVSLTVTLTAANNNSGTYQCGVHFNYNASNSVFVLLPDQIYSFPAMLYVVGGYNNTEMYYYISYHNYSFRLYSDCRSEYCSQCISLQHVHPHLQCCSPSHNYSHSYIPVDRKQCSHDQHIKCQCAQQHCWLIILLL